MSNADAAHGRTPVVPIGPVTRSIGGIIQPAAQAPVAAPEAASPAPVPSHQLTASVAQAPLQAVLEPVQYDMRGRPIKPKPAPVDVKRSLGQVVAAIGAAFLPIASYQLAHVEAQDRPYLWGLVAAALLFSAPSVASWAHTWSSKDPYAFPLKAWGFALLLEGVLILAHTEWLSLGGLSILVLTNAVAAWAGYAAFQRRLARGDED